MTMKRHKTRPGEFEIRITRDGRVFLVAADEAMFDLAEALAPDDACIAKRRKAKSNGRSSDVRTDADAAT